MRYRIAKIIAATAIGVVLLTATGLAAVPMVRHAASGWWHNPEGLPALPEDPRVHYETGGSEYARTVAGLLPAAIARVEAAHGLMLPRFGGHPHTTEGGVDNAENTSSVCARIQKANG